MNKIKLSREDAILLENLKLKRRVIELELEKLTTGMAKKYNLPDNTHFTAEGEYLVPIETNEVVNGGLQ